MAMKARRVKNLRKRMAKELRKKPAAKERDENDYEDIEAPAALPASSGGPEVEETDEMWEECRAKILKEIKTPKIKNDIDEKIKCFRKWFLEEKLVSHRQKLLKLFFSGDEMSKLWGRLKTQMKGSTKQVKEEWDAINELPNRSGKDQKKTIFWPSSWLTQKIGSSVWPRRCMQWALVNPKSWTSRNTTKTS